MARGEIILMIIGMGLATYFTRFGTFFFFGDKEIPPRVKVFLKYIPIAMLTAIIAPALVMPADELFLSTENHYLIAGVVAGAVAFVTKSVILTVAIGLGVVLLLC